METSQGVAAQMNWWDGSMMGSLAVKGLKEQKSNQAKRTL